MLYERKIHTNYSYLYLSLEELNKDLLSYDIYVASELSEDVKEIKKSEIEKYIRFYTEKALTEYLFPLQRIVRYGLDKYEFTFYDLGQRRNFFRQKTVAELKEYYELMQPVFEKLKTA